MPKRTPTLSFYVNVVPGEPVEYIGCCEQLPALSWCSEDEKEALDGIMALSFDCLDGLGDKEYERWYGVHFGDEKQS